MLSARIFALTTFIAAICMGAWCGTDRAPSGGCWGLYKNNAGKPGAYVQQLCLGPTPSATPTLALTCRNVTLNDGFKSERGELCVPRATPTASLTPTSTPTPVGER